MQEEYPCQFLLALIATERPGNMSVTRPGVAAMIV